jgi:hypothetical protein
MDLAIAIAIIGTVALLVGLKLISKPHKKLYH